MADRGPLTPQPSPIIPPLVPSVPPVQSPVSPAQAVAPPAPPGPMQELNWSHFKPEFVHKPDEDVVAHLVGINDWMDTHAFSKCV